MVPCFELEIYEKYMNFMNENEKIDKPERIMKSLMVQ